MKTHKLTESSNESYGFSECGKNFNFTGGQGSDEWDDVDCKNCLKHEFEEEQEPIVSQHPITKEYFLVTKYKRSPGNGSGIVTINKIKMSEEEVKKHFAVSLEDGSK